MKHFMLLTQARNHGAQTNGKMRPRAQSIQAQDTKAQQLIKMWPNLF